MSIEDGRFDWNNELGHEYIGSLENDWRNKAECKGASVNEMFPPDASSEVVAKEYCCRCSVTEQCLAAAINNNERYGIWGGLNATERRLLKKESSGVAGIRINALKMIKY
jgi:WhiB family redox-sensing transcriptional regulator